MKHARILGVTQALVPTIGRPRDDAGSLRRKAAARVWRQRPVDRAIPELRLTINPVWQVTFDLGRHSTHLLMSDQTRPSGHSQGQDTRTIPTMRRLRLDRLSSPPQSSGHRAVTAGALHRTPAQFVLVEGRTRPNIPAPLSAADAGAVSRLVRALLLPRHAAMRVFAAPPFDAGASAGPTRKAERLVPQRPMTGGATLLIGTRAGSRRTPQPMTAPYERPAILPQRLDAAQRVVREAQAAGSIAPASGPARTRGLAYVPMHGAAAARPVGAFAPRPAIRRAAIDLAWPVRAESAVTTRDLADLARSMAAPGITRTVAAVPGMASAAVAAPATVLPDAGRLVDEVMERLDRRMRSDRLRRGL